MSSKAVIGVYDSLAKVENAELRLEEAHLPVGLMSVLAPRLDDGEVEGDITAPGVADAVADTGVRLGATQINKYERVLQAGKFLLIFRGDADQVTKACRALENTDHDELSSLGG